MVRGPNLKGHLVLKEVDMTQFEEPSLAGAPGNTS